MKKYETPEISILAAEDIICASGEQENDVIIKVDKLFN